MQKSELQISLFEMQSGSCPWALWGFSIVFGLLDLKNCLIAWIFYLLGVIVGSQGQKIHTWTPDLETTKASVGSF